MAAGKTIAKSAGGFATKVLGGLGLATATGGASTLFGVPLWVLGLLGWEALDLFKEHSGNKATRSIAEIQAGSERMRLEAEGKLGKESAVRSDRMLEELRRMNRETEQDKRLDRRRSREEMMMQTLLGVLSSVSEGGPSPSAVMGGMAPRRPVHPQSIPGMMMY